MPEADLSSLKGPMGNLQNDLLAWNGIENTYVCFDLEKKSLKINNHAFGY